MADNVGYTPGVGATVKAEDQSGVLMQVIGVGPRLTTPLTEVAINCAASGDNTIVAAVAAQKVRLYRFFLTVADAVNIKWRDGVAGTDFHPALTMLGAGASWMLPMDGGVPWFTTTAANALVLNLSGAVQVSGRAYYIQSA